MIQLAVRPRHRVQYARFARPATLLAVALLLGTSNAFADQYRSEVRELPQTPPEIGQQDPAVLLKKTREPYPRALLLRELAAREAAAGRYRQAADYLDQALATGALSGVAAQAMREDLAGLRSASGDPDAVIGSLEPMRRSGRTMSPAQRAALGAAYARKRRYTEALPLLRSAVEAAGAAVDLSWLRALLAVHAGLGDDAAAADLALRVLRRAPQQDQSWLDAAAWQLKAKRDTRAQALLELAARQGMLSEPEQRMQLLRLTARIGAPFQAASLLRRWIEDGTVPSSAERRHLLAQLWLAAREAQLASTAIEASLQDRTDPQLLVQLAQVHMDQERYAEAERAFERAIAAGDDGADVHFSLAMARYQQADIDGALAALSSGPRGDAAQQKLSRSWSDYLQSGRAREQAMRAAVERQAQQGGAPDNLQARLGGGFEERRLDVTPTATGTSGDGLTPVGADRRGNADGTIPPWTGKTVSVSERVPEFTINAANQARYADKLAPGYRAMFEAYPDFAMPVHASQRSVVYPQAIEIASADNLERAKLVGADTLTGARLGFPFIHPQTGVEVMWNHRLRWRGNSMERRTTQVVVQANGATSSRIKQHERLLARYANLDAPSDLQQDNVLLYYLTWFTGSGDDFLALVHETANAERSPRALWVQPPGVPRLFRLPPVGYDQAFPGSEGLYFVDMLDMYNGPFDRYVWKLAGKRELYLPYNNHKLAEGDYDPRTLLKPGHLPSEVLRYELHRVWVVEATAREGTRHSFGRRVFYVDEDSWNVVLVENYDREGRLWRFQEGHLNYRPGIRAADCAPVVTYDLKDGRYFVNRLRVDDPEAQFGVPGIGARDFLPSAVRGRYVH